jgi:NAD(P)-dependent dehydrogenase (short-subunit alcohol dehydrogenase family)
MVALTAVEAFNSQLSDPMTYPAEPIVVITGGTSGIGEETAKNFAEWTVRPRIYILGRSQQSADRIIGECKLINPDAKLKFIQADLALLKNVDRVCTEISQLESRVNVLFLSAGELDIKNRKCRFNAADSPWKGQTKLRYNNDSDRRRLVQTDGHEHIWPCSRCTKYPAPSD